MPVSVRIASPKEPQASALLSASHALMQELFSEEENHFLDIEQLCVPSISFLVAEDGDTMLGCGALSRKSGYAELKSMFVSPAARNSGVAGALMTQLETVALKENIKVLRLETGNTLHAAHRLYERHGFTLCGPFGDYEKADASVFYEKNLG